MFEIKDLVKVSELAANHQLKITALVKFVQDCEMLHIDSLTKFNQFLDNHQTGVFLTFRQLDIFDLPKFKTNLTIKTNPYETKTFLGFRNTMVYDEEKLIACSYSIGNFVNIKTGLPTRLSQEAIDSIELGVPFEMEYTNRKVIKDDSYQLIKVENILIRNSHIDIYQHCNNVNYIEFSLNNLPDDYEIKRIRAEYKIALQLNEQALVKVYYNSSSYIIEIYNASEKLAFIAEFSNLKE
jgi:acyl-ACP thioesterase